MASAGYERIEGARLAGYGTFRLGGPCRALLDCRGPEALAEALWAAAGVPRVVIGEGSNVLFSDAGYDGVVIRYAAPGAAIARAGDVLTVPGAARLDDVAQYAAEAGLDGVGFCSGIPGTVGGAVAGNAGAWGRQIADCLVDVTLVGPDGRTETVPAAALGFVYRGSRLQHDGRVVASARLGLVPAPAPGLLAERARILARRGERHPDPAAIPCAGSFFRNLAPSSAAGRRQAAGWLLEQAGARDMTVGGASVFPGHANIIVAGPGCTAQHVHDLACRLAAAVRERFGVDLVREVRYLGRFNEEEIHPGFF